MSDKKDSGPATVIELTPGQILSAAIFMLIVAATIFFAGMFARGLTTSATNPPPSEPTSEPAIGTDIPAPEPPMQTASADTEPEDTTPAPPQPPEPEDSEPEPAEPTINTPPPAEIIEPDESDATQADPEPALEPVEVDVVPVKETMPEPASEPEESEPAPAPEPEPAETEQTPEPNPEPAETEQTPEPEPEPEPPAEPAPKPLPELPPSSDGQFTVQVMSIGVAKRANAEVFQRDALENKAVQVRLVDSADGKWVRAFVGTYATRAEADQAMRELRKAGFDGCFVKRLDE